MNLTEFMEFFMASRPRTVPSIPTGILALDSILTSRGWPGGRVSQVHGDANIGKSTLAYAAIAQAQRMELPTFLIDLDKSFSPEHSLIPGVDLDELIVTTDRRFGLRCCRLPKDAFVVVDSVACDEDLDLLSYIPRGVTTLVISQQRYIVKTRSDGRHRIGHVTTPVLPHSAVLVALSAVHRASGGMTLRAEVLRDDLAPSTPEDAKFCLRYGVGIDHEEDLLALGEQTGVIEINGSWYWFGQVRIGQGREGARRELRLDPALSEEIEDAVHSRMWIYR